MQNNTVSDIYSITKQLIGVVFPTPNARDLTVQIACDLEESAELLDTIQLSNSQLQYELGAAKAALTRISKILRRHPHEQAIFSDRLAALDALGDRFVTSVSVAHQAGFNLPGAILEIGRSNLTKLVDGKPIYNPDGKWKKGPDFKPPELASFI